MYLKIITANYYSVLNRLTKIKKVSSLNIINISNSKTETKMQDFPRNKKNPSSLEDISFFRSHIVFSRLQLQNTQVSLPNVLQYSFVFSKSIHFCFYIAVTWLPGFCILFQGFSSDEGLKYFGTCRSIVNGFNRMYLYSIFLYIMYLYLYLTL